MITRKGECYQEKEECLLSEDNFVAKSGKHGFESGDIAWEASTLPLSYTRQNRIYFNPKINSCKGGFSLMLRSIKQNREY